MLENEKHAKSDNYTNSNYIDTKDPIINTLFFGKYKAIKKLGEGSFGKVYKVEYNNKIYAMKLESKKHSQGILESEATIMTSFSSRTLRVAPWRIRSICSLIAESFSI